MADLHEIKNVEIFATGRHNNDTYDVDDLDEMVRAFEASDFRPPVKLGHSEDAGRPAFGWVDNLRRVGHKLVCDLTHIPKDVYELVKRRGYDTVSCEVFWNLERGGKVFRRALRALSLLGQEIPAVAGLQPLHALFSNMTGTVKFYTVDVGNGAGVDDWWRAALPTRTYREKMATHEKLKRMDLQRAQATAGEILDGKSRLLSERSKLSYSQAFQQTVRDPENNFLVELYSGFASPHTTRNSTEASSPEQAGAKLAVYAQELSRREGIPLHEAQVRVVQQHPKLAEMYENVGKHAKYR